MQIQERKEGRIRSLRNADDYDRNSQAACIETFRVFVICLIEKRQSIAEGCYGSFIKLLLAVGR